MRHHSLLGNGTVNTLLHHETACHHKARNKHATVEELLVAVFSVWSNLRLYNEDHHGIDKTATV
jgi:hypothetical protein